MKPFISLMLATICLAVPAAWAESEAGLEAGSEAQWGGWRSEAQWGTSRSEAQWGTSSSEAPWGTSSSAASSSYGSESGFSGNGFRNGGGYRGGYYPRRYARRNGYGRSGWNYGNNSPQVSSEAANQYQAMTRLRQDQQAQRKHDQQLSAEPDSDFVKTYNSNNGGQQNNAVSQPQQKLYNPGGLFDTYHRSKRSEQSASSY